MCLLKQSALLTVVSACLFATSGCVNEDGHFRPPDPIGRALFDLVDPPGRSRDRQYVQPDPLPPQPRPQPSQNAGDIPPPLRTTQQSAPVPQNSQIWVDGTWAWNNGNRVWVPGHWTQPATPIGSY